MKKNNEPQLAQIAWVVKDVEAAKQYFQDVMGVGPFQKTELVRLSEHEGTHYGQPSDGESLVSIAYSGGTFIELIQPVFGQSIFQDYINEHPAGGVQHIAYRVPVTEFDQVITEFQAKGHPVVTSVNTTIAKIVFFDTYKELGVMTELMSVTEEGAKAVEKMKRGS